MTNRKKTSIVKGVGLGMVAAGGMAMLGSSMMSPKAKTKKTATKAIKTVGEVVDTISKIF